MANQMRETKMHSIYIYASQTINEESQFSAVKGGGKISRYSSRKRLIFSPFSRGIFVNHLSTTSALWSWQILCTYFASQYSVQLDRSFIHSFTNPSIPSTCHCQRVFLSIWSQFHCFLAFCYIFAQFCRLCSFPGTGRRLLRDKQYQLTEGFAFGIPLS